VEAGATGIAAFGAFKAVRGISTKAAPLRTNYSRSKIDGTFQLKHTNPLELETRINQGVTEAVEANPYLKMQVERLSSEIVEHHIFNKFRGTSEKSQKYRDFFAKHGIDIDSFVVKVPRRMHVEEIHVAEHNWTTKWKNWINTNSEATTKEVYQFGGALMDEYGISHLPLEKYRSTKK
jgi:hypothetical protein